MKILAVTPGDPDGIGPEIVWKTLRSRRGIPLGTHLLCVGAAEPFRKLGAPIIEVAQDFRPPERKSPYVWLFPAPTTGSRFLPGLQAGWSIETATRMVIDGVADALVTGPISKDRLQRGGYRYAGHTDFLADLCGVSEGVTMMLANDQLRVALVTVHCALGDVPKRLTSKTLTRTIEQTVRWLQRDLGVQRPSVAVAGLNPHAGESGLFGAEDLKIIAPTIKKMNSAAKGAFTLTGPHPADTLFALNALKPPKKRFDAVICMYHDQGLIPVKLLDFENTVNITLGLPIVRTSVDHGTGFDIAGKGMANPASFQAAIRMALALTKGK